MTDKSFDPGDIAIDSSSSKAYVRTESGDWALANPLKDHHFGKIDLPPKTSQIAAITPGVLPTRCLLSQALVFGYKEIDLNKLCSHCLLAALVDGDNHQEVLRGALNLPFHVSEEGLPGRVAGLEYSAYDPDKGYVRYVYTNKAPAPPETCRHKE